MAASIVWGVRSGFRSGVKCSGTQLSDSVQQTPRDILAHMPCYHEGKRCESLLDYVQRKCCIDVTEVEDVQDIYDKVTNSFNENLAGQTFAGKFRVDYFLFIGSLKENTRIIDPRESPVTLEFDILVVSKLECDHKQLPRIIEEIKKKLKMHNFDIIQHGKKKYEYFLLKGHNTRFRVLVDIHPAFEKDNKLKVQLIRYKNQVYFWRDSHVIEEIEAIKGTTDHHRDAFRVLKFARLLIKPRYQRYVLKTAFLEHIENCKDCDVKACVLNILEILQEGYEKQNLINHFSKKDVLPRLMSILDVRHTKDELTASNISDLRKLLAADKYFNCVWQLFFRTERRFIETLQ